MSAIAKGRVPTFFEGFHGVKNSSINGTANYVTKLQAKSMTTFNFTGLEPFTDYVLAIYTKNLDDTFLTPIEDPVTLFIKTEQEQIITVLGDSRLSMSFVCIIFIYFLTIFA